MHAAVGAILLIALCATVLLVVWAREGVDVRIRRAQHHTHYHRDLR